MKILVTGTAGFIGYHITRKLILDGHQVIGLDNINHYYDVSLKKDRLANLGVDTSNLVYKNIVTSTLHENFKFVKAELVETDYIVELFKSLEFEVVIHLAAQAGVRYSITHPQIYIQSNIQGFFSIMEGCRAIAVKHFIYASSSSVYGANESIPFKPSDKTDNPVSIYAATKKSNELLAYSYSNIHQIPTTGLRFFTVYGPWGRPDMAIFLFTKAILEGKPINIFNNGNMQRDFTYVDDIVVGISKVINNPPKQDEEKAVPHKIYNLGNNKPVKLMDFITAIENATGKKAIKNFMPMQAGDVPITYADVRDLIKDIGYSPDKDIQDGINEFVNWYKEYYNINEHVELE